MAQIKKQIDRKELIGIAVCPIMVEAINYTMLYFMVSGYLAS